MSSNYKLQVDPSQISQQTLNQTIEIDKPNHIRGFHRAKTFVAISQSQGHTVGIRNKQNEACSGFPGHGILKR